MLNYKRKSGGHLPIKFEATAVLPEAWQSLSCQLAYLPNWVEFEYISHQRSISNGHKHRNIKTVGCDSITWKTPRHPKKLNAPEFRLRILATDVSEAGGMY
jgi:hypothetical protein